MGVSRRGCESLETREGVKAGYKCWVTWPGRIVSDMPLRSSFVTTAGAGGPAPALSPMLTPLSLLLLVMLMLFVVFVLLLLLLVETPSSAPSFGPYLKVTLRNSS